LTRQTFHDGIVQAGATRRDVRRGYERIEKLEISTRAESASVTHMKKCAIAAAEPQFASAMGNLRISRERED